MSCPPSVTTGTRWRGRAGAAGSRRRRCRAARPRLYAQLGEVRVQFRQFGKAGPGARERIQHEQDDLALAIARGASGRRGSDGKRASGRQLRGASGSTLAPRPRPSLAAASARGARSSRDPSAGPPVSSARKVPVTPASGIPSEIHQKRSPAVGCRVCGARRSAGGRGSRRPASPPPAPVGPWQTAQCSAQRRGPRGDGRRRVGNAGAGTSAGRRRWRGEEGPVPRPNCEMSTDRRPPPGALAGAQVREASAVTALQHGDLASDQNARPDRRGHLASRTAERREPEGHASPRRGERRGGWPWRRSRLTSMARPSAPSAATNRASRRMAGRPMLWPRRRARARVRRFMQRQGPR